MLAVRQQDRVDLADIGGLQGRPSRLCQPPAGHGVLARRIEGRIGEQTYSADVDDRGGTADGIDR